MLKAIKLRVNRQKMGTTLREHVVEGNEILLSWGAISAEHPARQQAFRLTMAAEQKEILDTGWVEGEEQSYRPDPALLPRGPRIAWRLWLKDSHGNQSGQAEQFFYIGEYPRQASWIRAAEENARKPAYFRRDFRIEKPVRYANLYACGLGYHRLYLNGVPTDDAALDPAHTDYAKTCQFVLWPEVEPLLRQGDNCIGAILGGGWRNNYGKYLGDNAQPEFFGPLQLTAVF